MAAPQPEAHAHPLVDEEDEEEEEHLALADFAIVIPTVELVSPPKGTEHVIPPPSTDTTTTEARIIVRLQAAISLPPKVEVERLLAMPTPPPSPLTLLSPPSARERLARCTTLFACLSPPPIPSPYYHHLAVQPKSKQSGWPPLRHLLIRDTWVDPAEAVPKIAPMIVGEVNTRVTELAELHEHYTHDLYALLEDAQEKTIMIVEEEAYVAREALAHSIGLSQAVHSELQTHYMRREMGDMQTTLLALREQLRRARQPGEDARVPNHHDVPRDADSHI
nr:hypothetical protein [Tanacetum cinerariifolium]